MGEDNKSLCMHIFGSVILNDITQLSTLASHDDYDENASRVRKTQDFTA